MGMFVAPGRGPATALDALGSVGQRREVDPGGRRRIDAEQPEAGPSAAILLVTPRGGGHDAAAATWGSTTTTTAGVAGLARPMPSSRDLPVVARRVTASVGSG